MTSSHVSEGKPFLEFTAFLYSIALRKFLLDFGSIECNTYSFLQRFNNSFILFFSRNNLKVLCLHASRALFFFVESK